MRVEKPRARTGLRQALLAAALVVSAVASVASIPVASRAATTTPLPPSSSSSSSLQTISYQGEQAEVPASWPVYNLSSDPSVCVRFNRSAVYEGAAGAGSATTCTADVLGVTTALQLQPITDREELEIADDLTPTTINGQSALLSGNEAVTHRYVVAFPATDVLATVSYGSDGALAAEIVGSFERSVRDGTASTQVVSARSAFSAPMSASRPSTAVPAARAQLALTTTVGTIDYEGRGFDTCDAPTPSQMASWKLDSPYAAIGVYIGGVNAACTNITASWIAMEATAGWAMFPLYVGLQAPCANQSGLEAMSDQASAASTEGREDAENAVDDAESFGVGSGATVYFDMEAWNTADSSCNTAVLDFLKGWTNELHALGYDSGVYGSLDAGVDPAIESLYGKAGCPDDLYFADWDGAAVTTSSEIPSTDWPGARRIKQYYGDVDQSYGGVSIDVDEDELDAPAVGYPRPTVSSISPATTVPGLTITVKGSGFVSGETTVRFGTVAGNDVDVTASSSLRVTVPSQPADTAAVRVTTPGGTSTDAPPKLTYAPFGAPAADSATGGYWLASAAGNVESFDAPFHGSEAGKKLPSPIVGMAATSTGYLLVTAKGNVYAFDTAWHGSEAGKKLPSPIVGIAATGSGGYLLVTAKGNVYNFDTAWYGSEAGKTLPSPIVGIAATASSGYLLASEEGDVYAFDAPFDGSETAKTLPSPVVGVAAPASGGYLLVTAEGNVYAFDTAWHGSEAGKKLPSPIVGIAATASGGYVLASRDGNVYSFDTPFEGSPASRG